jgi:hypothetical protein
MKGTSSNYGAICRLQAKPPTAQHILPGRKASLGVVHSASHRALQETLQPVSALEHEKRKERAQEWSVLQIVRTDEPDSPASTILRRGPQQEGVGAESVSSSSENDDSIMQTATSSSSPGQKLLAGARSLFVPDGWPASTTPDYMPYQLWALPTHGGLRYGKDANGSGGPLQQAGSGLSAVSDHRTKAWCCTWHSLYKR